MALTQAGNATPFETCWVEEGRLLHSTLLSVDALPGVLALGVRSVINCAFDGDYPSPDARAGIRAALEAGGVAETYLDIPFSTQFLGDDHLSSAWGHFAAHEGPVLVHCRLGQDRSAAVIAAMLARRDGLGAAEAMARVTARSRLAEPLDSAEPAIAAWLRNGRP